jgi:DNA-binding NtrC family response regulator
MTRILIADPDRETRDLLEAFCAERGAEAVVTTDGVRALRLASALEVDLVVAELRLPGMGGLDLIEALARAGRRVPVVIVAAFGSVEDAVRAMHAGAKDFVSKPFSREQIDLCLDRSLETAALVRENASLRAAWDDRLWLDGFIATDVRMRELFKTVRAVAPARTTVLITGESGTGKTRLARAIHGLSDRRAGPFVEVNCGALPDSLLESELFGHVRGAFTGAVRDRPGKFEVADGGTIFLDEIGTSSPGLQVKLLRVLQDRVIERVGDSRAVEVDVRVILATNLDLARAVADGRFREDLYYRIHVVAVEMPPLRARRGDIPALVEHFLARFREDTGKQAVRFTEAAMVALGAAPWPGNVRQLENVVERAVVLSDGREIDVDDLPADLCEVAAGCGAGGDPGAPTTMVAPDAHLLPLKDALAGPERTIIQRALAHHGGNRAMTAASLGINRSTLFNKMRRLGLLGGAPRARG